ncbi:MAG: hypothetical protein IOD05_16220 [Rhodobacter sp.]|nr:hypothetical protein [Rhodocyclaceae bacterium]MCA3504756.1 hypothetical protein [Rhodobacter sp.]
MLQGAWVIFKLAFSALLLCLGAAAAYTAIVDKLYSALAVTAVLLVFTWLLWVDWARPTRALGVLGLGFSAGCFFMAYELFIGNAVLPAECDQRRRELACHVVNALYTVGGSFLVSFLWALGAVLLAAPSLNALVRPRQLK